MNPWTRPAKPFRRIALAALFALALAVRLFRAHQLYEVTPDAVRFVLFAQALAIHPIQTMQSEAYHPLFSLCILALHTALPALRYAGGGSSLGVPARMSWIFAAQGIAIFFGALLSILIYRLARQFGAAFWPAIAAGTMWTLTKRTSAIGIDGMSDTLELSLFAGSMLLAMQAMRFGNGKFSRRQAFQFAAAGLLAGLAYLTRPEGLAAPLIVTLSLLAQFLFGHRRPVPKPKSPRAYGFKIFPSRPPALPALLASLAILFAFTLIPALPYMLTIGSLTHKKPLTLAPLNPFTAASQSASLAPENPPPAGAGSPSKENPPTPQWIMDEVCKTFSYACLAVMLLPLLWNPRFWGRPRLRVLAIIWTLLWLVVMFWLIKTAGYLNARHTLTLEAFLFAWLGVALGHWSRLIHALMSLSPIPPKQPAARALPAAFAAGAFLFIATLAILQLNTPPWPERASIAAAVDWIRSDVAGDVIVADRSLYVGFLSGHRFAGLGGDSGNPRLIFFADNATSSLSPPPGAADTAPAPAGPPLLLGALFEHNQKPFPAIGPYRPIASFLLLPTADTQGQTYVLYALPGAPVVKNPL